MILTAATPIPQDEEVGIRLLRIRRNEYMHERCSTGGENRGRSGHSPDYGFGRRDKASPILLNPWYPHPHQHVFDVHDENYTRQKNEKLQRDLHRTRHMPPPSQYNPNHYRPHHSPPMQYFTSGNIPGMPQGPPPPRLLRPEGKSKLKHLVRQQQEEKASRHKLLLDPFHPANNVVACSEDIKEDLKKKHKKIIKLKKYDSNDNSISEDLSIQLLKANYPMYNIANGIKYYADEEIQDQCPETSCSTESNNITTIDKSVQMNSTILEECTQTEGRAMPPVNVSNLGIQTSPEEQKKAPLKGEQLLEVLRNSRIMDLETYFQLMEKQEREGTSNSALDISILNNTAHFPEVPIATHTKGIADSRDLPNVSNIQCVNSSTDSKLTSRIPLTKNSPSKAIEITYALEDYMTPENVNQEKPTVTVTKRPSEPLRCDDQPYKLPLTDMKQLPTMLTRPESQSSVHHSSSTYSNVVKSEQCDHTPANARQNVVPIPIAQAATTAQLEEPFSSIITSNVENVKPSCHFNEELKPPPFEERIIYLDQEKPQQTLENPSYPTYSPTYMDKVIYIDELRKETRPSSCDKTEKASEADFSSVEIPYFEERIIDLGRAHNSTHLIEQAAVDDDNMSVTTIGSQETYEEYLQRVGIDITNMPFSSEAVKKKLELQMAISARNSLNFSRGSLLLPQDFDFGNQSFLSTLNSSIASTLRNSKLNNLTRKEDLEARKKSEQKKEEEPCEKHTTNPKQPETVESILRNILQSSNKIKSKLAKRNEEEHVHTPSILNQKNIHIEEIEEYKSLVTKLDQEFMTNADYLIAQTELMKEETEEALGRINRLQFIKKERFNESLDAVYHQKR
ncbi:hypothetical protein C9374_012690 [Naegleria lovaniensis]|uniref:Uncharacterized protein n=1 Tax=Naegleria lovaniensis TaxID=51637 RepID=A0AA88KNS7_NAELO|nr:uncharacterized protein C9374_012690 [Naegleria lovaniensis]KAG2392438.1 hypothetical protein C9374_012690 [Naegleria lovaniensis]